MTKLEDLKKKLKEAEEKEKIQKLEKKLFDKSIPGKTLSFIGKGFKKLIK